MRQELATRSSQMDVLRRTKEKLANAQTLDELAGIRDEAQAVQQFAKTARLGLEVLNEAAETKLRAERAAGKALAALKLRGGPRRSKSALLRLQELGVSQNESTRWQIEAKLPDDLFDEFINGVKKRGKELTAAALIRAVKNWSGKGTSPKQRSAGVGRSEPRTFTRPVLLSIEALERVEEARAHLETVRSLLDSRPNQASLPSSPYHGGVEKGVEYYVVQSVCLLREVMAEVVKTHG